MNRKSAALALKLSEVLDLEFVQQVLERKRVGEDTPQAKLLRSLTSRTLVWRRIVEITAKETKWVYLSDLASCSSSDVKRMAGLGKKTMQWLEAYLHLLGVTLSETESIYGMSKAARDFLATL